MAVRSSPFNSKRSAPRPFLQWGVGFDFTPESGDDTPPALPRSAVRHAPSFLQGVSQLVGSPSDSRHPVTYRVPLVSVSNACGMPSKEITAPFNTQTCKQQMSRPSAATQSERCRQLTVATAGRSRN